jgi:hypothetical protein
MVMKGCQPGSVRLQQSGREIFRVSGEGAVWLAPDLDLAAVRALPLPYLLAVREMVNTAIYDRERGGPAT